MHSYEYKVDEKSRAGSRFISRIKEELQRALITEKAGRKLTQQEIAGILGVNRSVVNRRFMGLENMTARSIGETLWAIGWEPHFEARKVEQNEGNNEFVKWPTIVSSTSSSSATEYEKKIMVTNK